MKRSLSPYQKLGLLLTVSLLTLLAVVLIGSLIANYSLLKANAALVQGVKENRPNLVLWALHHGADPNLRYSIPSSVPQSRRKWLQRLQRLWYGHPLYRPETEMPVLTEASRLGEEKTVALLLGYGAKANAVVVGSQQTPLTAAASRGYRGIVEQLLSHGADPNQVDGEGDTPLDAAAADYAPVPGGPYPDIVELLLEHGANPNYSPKLKSLLAVVVSLAGANYSMSLRTAYGKGLRTVELLLKYGADVNQRDDTGNTALFNACVAFCYPLAKVLVKAKANVNLTGGWGETPLTWAINSLHVSLCRLLLEVGADPNREDGLGECPLNMAVATLSAPLCRLLVQAGADPNHRDKTGRTPLEEAEAMHDPEILSALRSKGKVKKEAKRGTNKGRDRKSQ